MTNNQSLDWCTGCEVPEGHRVNLPADWREGDQLPDGLTVHVTPRERKPWDKGQFAFRGDPVCQNRVYL